MADISSAIGRGLSAAGETLAPFAMEEYRTKVMLQRDASLRSFNNQQRLLGQQHTEKMHGLSEDGANTRNAAGILGRKEAAEISASASKDNAATRAESSRYTADQSVEAARIRAGAANTVSAQDRLRLIEAAVKNRVELERGKRNPRDAMSYEDIRRAAIQDSDAALGMGKTYEQIEEEFVNKYIPPGITTGNTDGIISTATGSKIKRTTAPALAIHNENQRLTKEAVRDDYRRGKIDRQKATDLLKQLGGR
jgi:hypothetical protein